MAVLKSLWEATVWTGKKGISIVDSLKPEIQKSYEDFTKGLGDRKSNEEVRKKFEEQSGKSQAGIEAILASLQARCQREGLQLQELNLEEEGIKFDNYGDVMELRIPIEGLGESRVIGYFIDSKARKAYKYG